VLSLIAMLMVLVAPMAVRSLPAMELKTVAEDLRTSLRAARFDAIATNRESWVVIDLNANTYRRARGRRAADLPEGLRMVMIIARSELIEPGRGRIRFYPDGTSTGGEVRVVGETRALDVKVDWFDGNITVVEADAQ